MGMFDYLTHEGVRYQTKDTPDQYLSEYRIVNGRLLTDEWHMEEVPKAERPHPEAPDGDLLAILGCMRRVVDRTDVDLNWHGYINMVPDDGSGGECLAKFTDGDLVLFDRLPIQSESQPAGSRT